MPVRVYEIAKKLGLENKEVLAKAKEMGIAAARVPSSSLDLATAKQIETALIASIAHRRSRHWCGFLVGGFKAFNETQSVPLRPLTLVFGPNSSGKSSVIHA